MKKIEILQEVINAQEIIDLLIDENKMLNARIAKLENRVRDLESNISDSVIYKYKERRSYWYDNISRKQS